MSTNGCPKSDALAAWAVGGLPDDQFKTIGEHLKSCRSCQSRLNELDATRDNPEDRVQRPMSTDAVANKPQHPPLLQETSGLDTAAFGEPGATGELPIAPVRFGPYRVLSKLGEGGMGIVYKAEDTQLKRQVALKTLKVEAAEKTTSRQRFLREARAMAALSHPHVVTIYQVSDEGEVPYLAMEMLAGETLEERIQREGNPPGSFALPLASILKIARETTDGLAAAHKLGLIHRDIKPANIWLCEGDGSVKVLDFGLARTENEDVNLTQSGVVVGTPAYMAPEQAKGTPVDTRADLFSLGSVLYLLCTGTSPFLRATAFDSLLAVTMESPQKVRRMNPNVPPALAELIEKLLAKNPVDRPPSASAVRDALDAVIRQLGLGETEVVELPSAEAIRQREQRPATSSGKPRALKYLVVVLAALAVTGAIFFALLARSRHAKGHLRLLLPGDNVQVTLDGKPVETKDRRSEAPLAVGHHHLSIRRPGFLDFDEDFEVKPGEAVERTPVLTRPALTMPDKKWFALASRARVLLQAKMVGDMLAELNPGFDGNLKRVVHFKLVHLEGTDDLFDINGLTIDTDKLTNISPVAAFTKLKTLECRGTAPGKGKLSDLSSIKDMKITTLDCRNNPIDDFSVLKNSPITKIWCDEPERHLKELQQISTLNRLNGDPVPWKPK